MSGPVVQSLCTAEAAHQVGSQFFISRFKFLGQIFAKDILKLVFDRLIPFSETDVTKPTGSRVGRDFVDKIDQFREKSP